MKLHSWFFICICIELICVLEVINLLIVLRDLSISLAKMMHTSLFPFLAASFIERFTFSSSLCMPVSQREHAKPKPIL